MNDEQKAQLEEWHNLDRESVKLILEEGNTEMMIEEIRHYCELAEVLARALVNKTKE